MSQPTNLFEEDVKLGEVSDNTIFSPKTIQFIDSDATKKLKEEKLNEVQDIYSRDEKVLDDIVLNLNVFFNEIHRIKDFSSRKLPNEKTEVSQSELKKEKEKLLSSSKNVYQFNQDEFEVLFNLSSNDLNKLRDIIQKEIERIYTAGVTKENLESTKIDFISLKDNTSFYLFFSKEVTEPLINKIAKNLKPNFTIDKETTSTKKDEALLSVGDVYIDVKKGETIVSAGDVVTELQIEKLEKLGIINQTYNFKDSLKQLPYFALIFLVFYVYGFLFHKKMFNKTKTFLFLNGFITLVVISTNLIHDTLADFFLFLPLLTSLMIAMVFWGKRFVITYSIIIGLVALVGDISYLAISVIAGLMLTVGFNKNNKRINIIISGIILGGVLSFSGLVVNYSFNQSFSPETAFSLLISSFVASVLTVGLIPLIENALGLVTSVKLYELSDQNHKLLKELMRNALGTYTHSIMVGNLAEMAADAIGADGLLLKIGAYFHDVGKLKNPQYFIENTTPTQNPHNSLKPQESAEIIRRHPIDSVEMCRRHNIPEPIIKLIASHHGDAILYHLVEKAKEEKQEIHLEDFKYQTPTPKTKEEGILLLADSTEAFSRVIIDKPKEIIENEIRNMIFNKVKHGVLRDCALTLKELDIIIETFVNYLVNSNHQRISYK